MTFRLKALYLALLSLLLFPAPIVTAQPNQIDTTCDQAVLYCPTSSIDELGGLITNFPNPNIAGPQKAIATPILKVSRPITRTVTYDIAARGAITTDLAQFRILAAETYADSRGWSRLGVQFKEVGSNGDFTLIISTAEQMTSFGPPCDTVYSCQTGRYVIINQNRWLGATDPWNSVGGDLRNYRHLAINHETGHWLGHGHTACTGEGQAATVMMQQSIELGGCKFNPWPLDTEIWSTRLGI